jgi:peroxiredoxin
MIQVGDTLPDATLVEKHEEVKVRDLLKGKTCILLGMPGELRRTLCRCAWRLPYRVRPA